MRLTTMTWLKLESIGKPQFNKTSQGTIREHMMTIAKWLSECHMGSRISITLARTESELNQGKQEIELGEYSNFLDSLNEIADNELSTATHICAHVNTVVRKIPNQTEPVEYCTDCSLFAGEWESK